MEIILPTKLGDWGIPPLFYTSYPSYFGWGRGERSEGRNSWQAYQISSDFPTRSFYGPINSARSALRYNLNSYSHYDHTMYKRRRYSYAGPYRALGSAAATALSGAWKTYTSPRSKVRKMASRTGTRYKRRSNYRSGNGTSYQRDTKEVYRRKPAPRRVKRAYSKFARRVNSVIDRTAGSSQLILSNGFSATSTDDGQNVFAILLGGGTGSTSDWNGDLLRIINSREDAQDTDLGFNRKIHMKTQILDCTFKNDFVTPGFDDELRDPIELDIYEFYVKKQAPFAAAEVLMTTEQSSETTPLVGTTAVTPLNVGATPFQFSNVGRYVTITKKTKHFIAPGNSVTYQIRDAKNRWLPVDRIIDQTASTFGFPGWTKGIFVVFKGAPFKYPEETYTARAAAARVSGSVTRIYNWRNVIRKAGDHTAYVPIAT